MFGSFTDLNLSSCIVQALENEGITVPTEIQAETIPLQMKNKDLIMQSETGTGKTLAYLLPLFHKFKKGSKELNSVILTPTHELSIQVQRQVERLSKNSGLEILSQPLIGSANISRQIKNLKKKPEFIVGSPGRILELIKKRKINMHSVKTIILDEADQLLDAGNIKSVLSIIKSTRKDRQVVMASASMLNDTVDTGKEIMNDPVIIRLKATVSIPEKIEHWFFIAEQRDKIELLRKLLNSLKPRKALIFLNKPDLIETLCSKLEYHKLSNVSLHGTEQKLIREKAMDAFSSGKMKILIASDLASRGLHMKGITHIFNMDIPESPKDYLHRAGRTGRMDSSGNVISLSTKHELCLLKKTAESLKINIQEQTLSDIQLLTVEGNECSPPKSHLG